MTAFWLTEAPHLGSNKAKPGDADYGQPGPLPPGHGTKHKGKGPGGGQFAPGRVVAGVGPIGQPDPRAAAGVPQRVPFDPGVAAAVVAFQKKHGLVVDGIVGKQTALALAGHFEKARATKPGPLDAKGVAKAVAAFRGRHPVNGKGAKAKAKKPASHIGGGVLLAGLEEGVFGRPRQGFEKQFDEALHPRGYHGKFAKKLGGMKVGERTTLGNLSIHKQGPTSFHVMGKDGRSTHHVSLGGAVNSILDQSARDSHPGAVGGRDRYSSFARFRQLSPHVAAHRADASKPKTVPDGPDGKGRLPEHALPGAVGSGVWTPHVEETAQRLSKVANPEKDNTQTENASKVVRDADGNIQSIVYTPERKALHRQILKLLLEGAEPVKPPAKPQALFMAGGPAAGKSSVLRNGSVVAPSAHVEVNPDIIKTMLPEYERLKQLDPERAAHLVHEESSDLAKQLTRLAQERRMNIVVDGVGGGKAPKDEPGGVGKYHKKILDMRAKGYDVRAVYVGAPVDQAWNDAVERGKSSGRVLREALVRHEHAAVANRFQDSIQPDTTIPVEVYYRQGGTLTHIYSRPAGSDGKVLDPARMTAFLKAQRTFP